MDERVKERRSTGRNSDDGLSFQSDGAREEQKGRRKRRSTFLYDRELHVTYAVAMAGLSLLFLVNRGTPLWANFLALVGPVVHFGISDALSKSSLKHKKVVNDQLSVISFACAAAGIAGVKLGDFSLLSLNTMGAFINGFLLVLSEHHKRCTRESFLTLDKFRGVFCGVFTSFAGAVHLSAGDPRGLGIGFVYFVQSLAAGMFATEAGLRVGGQLSEALILEPRYQPRLKFFSHWLPFVCSYLAVSAFLAAPLDSKGLVVSSYVFSALGAFAGDLADVSDDGLVQDFFSNTSAVVLLVLSVVACHRWRGPSKLGALVCSSYVQGEFSGSFCGAVSTFCGSAMIMHNLVKSFLPEDILEDVYFNHKLIGSNTLREIEHVVDDTEDLEESQALKEKRRLIVRVVGEFCLVFFAHLVFKLAQ